MKKIIKQDNRLIFEEVIDFEYLDDLFEMDEIDVENDDLEERS